MPLARWMVPLALWAALLGGCAHGGRPLSSDPAYQQELARWLRTGKVLDELDLKADVRAVLLASSMKQAVIKRLAALYDTTTDHGPELLDRQGLSGVGGTVVVLALYTPDRRWNDLTRNGSIWRVTLVDGQGLEHKPREVARLKRMSPNDRALWPFLGHHDEGYVVRFGPDAPPNLPLTLKLASGLGALEVLWAAP